MEYVSHTNQGTPYLTQPHVIELAHTVTSIPAPQFAQFINELGMDGLAYLQGVDEIPVSEAVLKVAGQNCYLSYGDGHTTHDKVGLYLDNLKQAGDGSVFSHSSATFLLYGVSRSFTHELVRHGVGTAFSQTSQRYVGPEILRFVERPEYQASQMLHESFCDWIDQVRLEYIQRIAILWDALYPPQQLTVPASISRAEMRERRKAVQGAARGCLPNETESPIVITANYRAWRNILEQRTNRLAEKEIRILGNVVYPYLKRLAPNVFSDYLPTALDDGTIEYTTNWKRI